MKPLILLVSVSGLALTTLSGCESWTDKVEPGDLSTLRSGGIEQDARTKNDERLQKVLDRDNITGSLKASFDGLSSPSGTGLADLMSTALERNSDIGRAAQGINRAHAARLNAIFGYLPQVSISLQKDKLDQRVVSSDNQVFQLGDAQYEVKTQKLTLTQPLIDVARIFSIRQATTARSLAEIEYVKAVKDTVAGVYDTYLVAVQAKEKTRFLNERLRLIDQQVNSAQTQADTGVSGRGETSEFQSDRASLAAEIAFERNRLADALGSLSRMTGIAVRDVSTASLGSVRSAARRLPVEQAVARGMRENPAVMAAAFRVVLADEEKKEAIASDFAPVLSAYASIEKEDRGNSRFGGGSVTDDRTYGVVLNIPIFNARGDGIAALTGVVDERLAALDYYGVRAEVEAGIRASHAQMEALQTSRSQAQRAERSARRALRQSRSRVEAGEAADFVTLTQRIRLNAAEERSAFFENEYLRSFGRLQYLSGTSLESVVR